MKKKEGAPLRMHQHIGKHNGKRVLKNNTVHQNVDEHETYHAVQGT